MTPKNANKLLIHYPYSYSEDTVQTLGEAGYLYHYPNIFCITNLFSERESSGIPAYKLVYCPISHLRSVVN